MILEILRCHTATIRRHDRYQTRTSRKGCIMSENDKDNENKSKKLAIKSHLRKHSSRKENQVIQKAGQRNQVIYIFLMRA